MAANVALRLDEEQAYVVTEASSKAHLVRKPASSTGVTITNPAQAGRCRGCILAANRSGN